MKRRKPLRSSGPIARKPRAKTGKKAKSPMAIQRQEEQGQKLTSSQIIKLADIQWAKLVKLHANYVCEWCGAPGVDAHHMVGRRHAATRLLPENGVCLCKGCHIRFHTKESLTGWAMFEAQRPESFRLVSMLRNVTCKRGVAELRTILEDLRAKVKEFDQ